MLSLSAFFESISLLRAERAMIQYVGVLAGQAQQSEQKIFNIISRLHKWVPLIFPGSVQESKNWPFVLTMAKNML